MREFALVESIEGHKAIEHLTLLHVLLVRVIVQRLHPCMVDGIGSLGLQENTKDYIMKSNTGDLTILYDPPGESLFLNALRWNWRRQNSTARAALPDPRWRCRAWILVGFTSLVKLHSISLT